MDTKEFARAVHEARFDLFDSDYSAEKNLQGRTHYFSADTRKFHGSREVFRRALFDGLILGAVESTALDPDKRSRGFRPVFFDLDGFVIYRPELENCFRTRRAAEKDFWRFVDTIDPVSITRALMLRKMKRAAETIANYSRVCALQVETA